LIAPCSFSFQDALLSLQEYYKPSEVEFHIVPYFNAIVILWFIDRYTSIVTHRNILNFKLLQVSIDLHANFFEKIDLQTERRDVRRKRI